MNRSLPVSEVLQSVWFMKVEYDKEKATKWLTSNHYPVTGLKSAGSYWEYNVHPLQLFEKSTLRKQPVDGITFIYGKYRQKKGKFKKEVKKQKTQENWKNLFKGLSLRETDPLKDTKDIAPPHSISRSPPGLLDPPLPSRNGTGLKIQSVRIPKKWGIAKARDWVDEHRYKASYYGKSPFTETPNYYRFRQSPAVKGIYKTMLLPNKVQLVSNR